MIKSTPEIQPSTPAKVPTASDASLSDISISACVASELTRATVEPTNGVMWSFMGN